MPDEPVRKCGLLALLKTMKFLEEDFPEIDDAIPATADAWFMATDSRQRRS